MRYKNEIFDNYIKTENVVYGNAPDLPFIFGFEWNTYDIDLTMDIYEAEGDTATNRPVIIFLHPGAFFTGNNEVDDMVALSISSAKMGYVAASLTYRLGLNVLSSYSAERAVYRGVQDASAAIRYFREHHEEFGIDYDNIYVWGSSAGSFIGLHLTYMEEDERPMSTYGSGGDPDLGCIDCEGNVFDHYSYPNALVSCWGAIGDLNWINENNTIPLIMFHGSSDAVVPFNSGFPFTIDLFLPVVYGSNLINERLNTLNIQNDFYGEPNLPHEYWGTSNGTWSNGPNEYFDIIKEDAYSFLFNVKYPFQLGDINNDGLVNFLDVSHVASAIIYNDSSSFNSYYSDLNFDGETNVFDLIILISFINNN
tara:strand:- start:8723 stop:9820 length:1098 start_codon:yes stop_codon:yes gene_type:complete